MSSNRGRSPPPQDRAAVSGLCGRTRFGLSFLLSFPCSFRGGRRSATALPRGATSTTLQAGFSVLFLLAFYIIVSVQGTQKYLTCRVYRLPTQRISTQSHDSRTRGSCPHAAAETDHMDMRESATHRGETRDALGIRASWCPRAAPASHHHHKARCRLSLLTLSPARHAHTHTRHSTPHHTFHSHAHNAVQRRIGRVGAAAPGGEVGIRRRSRAPTPHSHAPCPRGHTYTNGSNGGGAERRRRHRRSSAPSPAAHRRRRAAAARQRR